MIEVKAREVNLRLEKTGESSWNIESTVEFSDDSIHKLIPKKYDVHDVLIIPTLDFILDFVKTLKIKCIVVIKGDIDRSVYDYIKGFVTEVKFE